jgi:ribosome-binding factor A
VDKSIKLLRTESILRELIPEAIATLNDKNINSVTVVDVKCSRGKYDAVVFLDPAFYDESEKRYIISHLKKAGGYLQSYCKQAEGWYRAPKFTFEFDKTLSTQNKIDELFKKIDKELHKNGQ